MSDRLDIRALAAELGAPPRVQEIASSIYTQESSAGRNTVTSNAGAVGGMQILPATFSRFSVKGEDIANPTHNAKAGVRYLMHLDRVSGGDPRLTAVGYYGGEGAIAKARAGVAVRDPRNPNAPDTLQYAEEVVSRLGGPGTPPAPQTKKASIAPPPVLNPDPLKEEMPDKTRRAGGAGVTIPPLTDINLPPDVDLAAAAKVAGDAAQAKVALTDYSLLEQARRASDSSGFMGAITRTIADLSRDSTVDPLYKTDPKKLVGLTESEQEHVLSSTSLQDEEYRLWQIKDRKESAEIVAAKGAGRAFLAGTLSELPVGFGSGIAASRAFAAMRSAGLVGGGYGTLAAEGFASSSVVEVLQAQIDPWWSKDDAIANVVLGTALEVGLGSASLVREGKLQRRLEETQAAVMDQRLLDQQEAMRRVGADADPEKVAKEVENLRSARMDTAAPQLTVDPARAAPAARWDANAAVDDSGSPAQLTEGNPLVGVGAVPGRAAVVNVPSLRSMEWTASVVPAAQQLPQWAGSLGNRVVTTASPLPGSSGAAFDPISQRVFVNMQHPNAEWELGAVIGAQVRLSGVLGKEYGNVLAAFDALPEAKTLRKQYPRDDSASADRRIAELVRLYPDYPVVTRLLDTLRAWWAKLTGADTLTRKQLVDLVQRVAKSDSPADIVTYHGGPSAFGEFSTDFVGTGEGNVAQGWGLYFSESKQIAQWYRAKESVARGGTTEDGSEYVVRIARSPDDFLQWADTEQSPKVAEALGQLGVPSGSTGEQAYMHLLTKQRGDTALARAKATSELLHSAGIAGTAYTARGTAGTLRNYVAYSDKDVSVTYSRHGGTDPARSLSRHQLGLLARAMQTLRSLFRSTPGGDGMGKPDTSWQGWDSATVWEHRARDFGPGGKNAGTIERMTFGQYKSFRELDALPAGIHLQAGRDFTPHLKSLETLRKKFLGEGMRIVLADADPELKALNANGAAIMLKENLVIINLDLSKSVRDQIPVLLHEVGHAVWQKYASKLTPKMRADIDRAYQDFLHASGREQARMRYANYNKNATVSVGKTKYELSRDEFSAEQFVKFIEDDVLRGSNSLRLERSFAESLVATVMKMLAFFKEGIAGFRRADVAYGNLFESILDKQSAMQQAAKQVRAATAPTSRSLSVSTVPDDGLNLAPNATAQQGAEAKFIAQLYEEARSPDFEVDERRLSKLYNTALFQGAQSNTNTLLRSDNPVARMFAAKFMESPSGAAGRRANPAIAKTLHERAMLGNAVNEVQAAYRDYRQAIGGSVTEDTFGGKHWDAFNRAVAQEIEARGKGSPVQSPASVKQAADALEKAYERALKLQVSTKTTGWANLPTNSRGYMPHRLSKDKLLTAKPKEFGALHDALTDQFIHLGMDMSFADQLAAKYVTRAQERALGGFDTPTGAQHVGAAEVVEEALEAMGMSRAEVLDTMKRFMRAGPGHTKARLELDLNKEYLLEDGSTFRLGDFYEYDQLNLLRSQVGRVSGEVALTEFGIQGKAGLDLYRRAFMYGEGRVTQEELGAFDQFAAEMMGMPYGTQSKVVDRMIQANSLARLGGMGFTQAAEAINGMWHLGVGRMMDTIIGIPRLRDEIKAMVRGEAVDNPIIGSVERAYGGAEFGTDSYKTVFPFDNKALEVQAYGQETITLMDRLLRGGGHLQGKLSMWRTLHATQQRGMAEGIVRKAAVYLKDGGEADVWLRDMGLSDNLIQRLRADLDKIAEFDSAGRLAKLDITKTDAEVAREFAQVVWRGVNQIIQGTFPGERNRWATDAHMRLLTQFRTFSLTAVEKQWGRMVGNVGAYKAAGILIGSMCAVLPIYAARVYAGALGRDDADEYIDRAFEPERIARQVMNYTASSGLVGDLLDVLGATSGVSLGGRTGTQEEAFFGSLVAPSADLLNDLYGAVQNTEEGTSFEALAKSAPFSKLPYVVPVVNVLFAD